MPNRDNTESSNYFVLATADICPHGGSSSLCEWCGYKAQVENLKLSRKAEIDGMVKILLTLKDISFCDYCNTYNKEYFKKFEEACDQYNEKFGSPK